MTPHPKKPQQHNPGRSQQTAWTKYQVALEPQSQSEGGTPTMSEEGEARAPISWEGALESHHPLTMSPSNLETSTCSAFISLLCKSLQTCTVSSPNQSFILTSNQRPGYWPGFTFPEHWGRNVPGGLRGNDSGIRSVRVRRDSSDAH